MAFWKYVKNYFFKLLFISLSIILLVFFFIRLSTSVGLYSLVIQFIQSKKLLLVFSFFLMVFSLFIKGYRFQILLKIKHSNLCLRKFLAPFFVGYGFSTFGPLKSGELVSVEVNKQSLDISRTVSLAALVFFRVLDMLVILVLLVFALGFTVPKFIQEYELVLLIHIIFYFSLIGTFFLILIFFVPAIGYFSVSIISKILVKIFPNKKSRFEKQFKETLDNYYSTLKLIYRDGKLALFVLFLTVFRWFIEILSFHLTILAFGGQVALFDTLSIFSIILLAGVISLVPAGIGVGTITSQLLLEQLSVSVASAGSTTIYQTLLGPGLTITVAFFASLFLKNKHLNVDSEDNSDD